MMKIKIKEVERGLHTCQYKDCKTDAVRKVNNQYLCMKHFKSQGYDKVYDEQLANQPTPAFYSKL